MLRQKAKIEWSKKVDMNSKFFNSRLKWRRLNNDIKGLQIEG